LQGLVGARPHTPWENRRGRLTRGRTGSTIIPIHRTGGPSVPPASPAAIITFGDSPYESTVPPPPPGGRGFGRRSRGPLRGQEDPGRTKHSDDRGRPVPACGRAG